MKIRDLRSIAVCVALAIVLTPLAACTPAAMPSDDPTTSTEEEIAPPTAQDGDEETPVAIGDMHGCSDAVVEYALSNGYPEAVPLDPTSLEIPRAEFSVQPDCYLVDEYSDVVRYSAFWQSDPQGVLTSLGTALSGAGYIQSEDYGPLVWWVDGDDPTTAEHAISAATQPVDGVEVLWATW